jgi:hypothetical protein
MKNRVLVKSLVLKDNTFQLEAEGSEPLIIMQDFEKSGLFSSIKLVQVYPAENGKSRYSMTGAYNGR